MKYLAVAHNKDYIAWAHFQDKLLHSADKITFNDFHENNQLNEIYYRIIEIVESFNIGIMIVKELDIKQIKKEELSYYYKIRAILQLVATQYNVIFIESRIDGWELYITKGKNTVKKKLEIVNNGYALPFTEDEYNFYTDDVEVANAIILGEAMAHKRIFI